MTNEAAVKKEATVKKLTLDDFIVPTLTDKPSKLLMTLDGNETVEFLQVISATHADLRRPLMKYGLAINKLKDSCKPIEDEVDRIVTFSEGEEKLEKELAFHMTAGWSLGEFNAQLLNKLLNNNKGIVKGIIIQSYTASDYTTKK